MASKLAADFCVEALREAITSTAEIFTTDHGSQFTSGDFVGVLREHGIETSMRGKRCWRANLSVERPVANDQVRAGLLVRLRYRGRGLLGADRVARILQPPASELRT